MIVSTGYVNLQLYQFAPQTQKLIKLVKLVEWLKMLTEEIFKISLKLFRL